MTFSTSEAVKLAPLPIRSLAGKISLRLHRTFAHGLKAAWYRDVVRPRILMTAPIAGTIDDRCEIHVMTSSGDWLNLVWALKSFYLASRRRYALCIHEDGSLDEHALAHLKHHFPAARIIRRTEADPVIEKELSGFPRSLAFRKANLLAPKVFDFTAFLQSDRMALFDSDLLFFAEPTAFLRRVEDTSYATNTFNGDVGDAYAVDRATVAPLIGHQLVARINSGLGLVHRPSMRWDWTEEFLALPGILDEHFWRIEQTLFALCSSRYGVELLPEEYTLRLERGIGARPFRHYVGAIRHLMYSEGMAHLCQQGLLNGTMAGQPAVV